MSRNIVESTLLRTSSGSDIVCGGGQLSITGLKTPTPLSVIGSITQTKYRAEVAQVVRVGGTSYTPMPNTKYTIWIYDPLRRQAGYQETPEPFSITTGSDLSIYGNAAAQREFIHAALVVKINNASAIIHATAASLGSGTGIAITDAGGYYPVWSQTMTNVRGANTVIPVTNGDGSGFAATNVSTTTAAVYASGVGAKLAQEVPIVDAIYGNLISGVLVAPPVTVDGLPAVSGQNYDLFAINSLQLSNAIGITGQYLYQQKTQYIWVDNGTGSSTTNLTGFLAFEKAIRKYIGKVYSGDPSAWIEFYDYPTFFQGAAGAVPTTTGQNKVATPYGQFIYTQVGTQTITTPTPGDSGLILDQDLTATEGSEYSPSLLTANSQYFTVGQQEFSFVYKTVCADHTDANLYIGFRRKAAQAADFNNYTDLGAIGFLGDLVYTWGILNDAATVATNTTVVPTDSAYEEYYVNVALDGTVTVKRNNIAYPVYSVGTTPLIFDAGDQMIPFFLQTNIGGGDPDLIVNHHLATQGSSWLI